MTEIWFEVSVTAYNFILEIYWGKIKCKKVYLPISEVYITEDVSNIYGFIALLENKIAAIFVSPQQKVKAVGTILTIYGKNYKQFQIKCLLKK